MPSKHGFGNSRTPMTKKVSYGSAMHYKNPIKKTTDLEKMAQKNAINNQKLRDENKLDTSVKERNFRQLRKEIQPKRDRTKPKSPQDLDAEGYPKQNKTKRKTKKQRGWFGLKDMGITEALDAMTKKQNE